MYRLITESLLGLHLEVDKLRFAPRIPPDWPSYTVHYRYRETVYHITVRNSGTGQTVRRVTVDGVEQMERTVPLADDRNNHFVELEI
jgi:cellobiose phosphorylase